MARKETKKKKISRPTSSRSTKELSTLGLGESETSYSLTYSPESLEIFDNKNPGQEAWTSFVCTEFTSLCPKTNQPDFAKVFINYVADKKMVESKSLKLYLFSFRNHGDFHEDCIQKICDDLVKNMRPKYLEVIGEFTPRGGISIFPFSSYAKKEKKFLALKQKRFQEYAPGKYTMSLARIYT